MTTQLQFDTVIVGAGVSGLYTALHLPETENILIICKEDPSICDSMLAQGGICVLLDENDYESFFEDTMKAGHYENRRESVDIMVRESRSIIDHLVDLGVDFDTNPDGTMKYTKEGAHSKARICFHQDITGQEITTILQKHVFALPNVTLMAHTKMTDLIVEGITCHGIVAQNSDDESFEIRAKNTVLATGGIGGRYKHTTNYQSMTGDALVLAEKYNIELEHPDYVQIHPTSLYRDTPGRSFLISESARGEGAILLNAKGERFVNELLPRDTVTEAIHKEMEKEGTDFVRLSFETIEEKVIHEHFPNIYKTCLEA
ncbi:MAG: FAD-dependent oxidoreductase, partial [Firmicutes bacterium]|nr:FAD-dependent oxidoreductase [Bacillota bacterium]